MVYRRRGGQARSALAAGADVVLACGGDGTIRHVAQVLAGSGTPLGLVPTGTSNLRTRGLWMAHQLCDELYRWPHPTTIQLHIDRHKAI